MLELLTASSFGLYPMYVSPGCRRKVFLVVVGTYTSTAQIELYQIQMGGWLVIWLGHHNFGSTLDK